MKASTTREGLVVKVIQDEDAQNPRQEFDNLGTMVLFHGRYKMGDLGHGYSMGDFGSWSELKEGIVDRSGPLAAILPVYMLDHSGLAISTSPFSCPWDSGQIGFIFVTVEKMEEEKLDVSQAQTFLEGEVETYHQYLSGDVYGYKIETPQGEELDSCWGFYGTESVEEAVNDFFKGRAAT